MNAAPERITATIIPFPTGGIRSLRPRGERTEINAKPQAGLYSDLAFGGGWYHDEAIQAPTEPTGKLS